MRFGSVQLPKEKLQHLDLIYKQADALSITIGQLPNGRGKSEALTLLDSCILWAGKALRDHEVEQNQALTSKPEPSHVIDAAAYAMQEPKVEPKAEKKTTTAKKAAAPQKQSEPETQSTFDLNQEPEQTEFDFGAIEAPKKALTIDDVQAAAVAYAKKHGGKQVLGILGEYGVTQIKMLSPVQLEDFANKIGFGA